MKNNIILLIDNLDIIKKAKEVGITTFLFPMADYSVGYEITYNISDINEEAFLLINRNLDNNDIDQLKEVLKNIPSNIKGIVFEDLGLINILKGTNLLKIYNAKHLNCSTNSVKQMLKYVDSVILSTDLIEKEITTIINHTDGLSSIYAFGLNQIFYSRRTLISNYDKEYNLSSNKSINVLEDLSKQYFKVVENDYGTVFYTGKFYNALRLLEHNNVKHFFINLAYLDSNNQNSLLDNFSNSIYNVDNLSISYSSYNLDKTTYFKLPPKEGDKHE